MKWSVFRDQHAVECPGRDARQLERLSRSARTTMTPASSALEPRQRPHITVHG
jgi:hypothetical protein